jgi:hypothetical protein
MTVYKCCDGSIFVAPELAAFGGNVPLRWARQADDVEKGQDEDDK